MELRRGEDEERERERGGKGENCKKESRERVLYVTTDSTGHTTELLISDTLQKTRDSLHLLCVYACVCVCVHVCMCVYVCARTCVCDSVEE